MQPSPRARYWQLPDRRLEFGPQPVLMGIVNVTPDSFSDGGRYFSEDAAVAHALELVEQGADILDIGGESTRPYAEPVSEEEEMRRVLPVVRRLAASTSVPISIDTSKAAVARAALEAGATIVNDVTALRADPRMLDVIQQYRAAVCIMHMQGTPQTMQDNPHYEDVVSEVLAFLRERRDALLQAGVSVDRIAIDPGIGFGKTTAHNIELLKNIGRFHTLGCPVLVGHSRKGFIGKVIGDLQRDRVAGGIGVSLAMALRGVQILRVHDVEATRQALALFAACGALVDLPEDQPSEVDPMPGIR
ncbi:MAG: dihydropteroate synthase [Pirellulaceae bacterium]|nr:MAG: dihydropteroate synthase [Pirellulaceae bacterium]